jgi:hypothetical protein
LLRASEAAHLGTALLVTPDQLLLQEITIFNDRVRVDVQTRTPGIEFGDARNRRQEMTYQNVTFQVVGLEDLISSKRAAARPIDLQDILMLELKRDD